MGMPLLRPSAAKRAGALLTATAEGREGLLEGLEGSLKSDAALRAQLAALLNKQMNYAGGNGGILVPAARFSR